MNLRQRVHYFFTETQYDLVEKVFGEDTSYRTCDWQEKWIEDPVRWLLKHGCGWLGHIPVADHCGIPAHDYCDACHQRTPGQARRKSWPTN